MMLPTDKKSTGSLAMKFAEYPHNGAKQFRQLLYS